MRALQCKTTYRDALLKIQPPLQKAYSLAGETIFIYLFIIFYLFFFREGEKKREEKTLM